MMQNTQLLVKYCRVCGDRASGFNYNGLCCESCKVFFLRNWSKKLECLKHENCDIDVSTRKSCAKCRLAKCYSNGMFIKATCKEITKEEPKLIANDQNIRYILENIENLFDWPSPVELNLPSCPYIVTRKNKYDSELIVQEREVITKVQCVLGEAFVDETNLRIIGSVHKPIDSFRLSALYVRRIIRFCKNIPAFKQLGEHDQLIILKPFIYEILMVRFVYMWDLVKDGYPIIENESASHALFVLIDAMIKQFKNQEIVQEALKFNLNLREVLENDFTIRDLLIAVLLFKPRENISNVEFVRYQYFLYCRLLRRYLEHKYKNVNQANRKYQSLICIADNFNHYREKSRFLTITEMDIAQIPEIIREIMNLN